LSSVCNARKRRRKYREYLACTAAIGNPSIEAIT
jgi:hypothetical protein